MKTSADGSEPEAASAARPFRLVSLDVPDAGVLQILIVADDPLVRAGISSLFLDQPGYAVVGALPVDGDLAAALEGFRPDVVLWDLGRAEAQAADVLDLRDAGLPVVALLPDESLVAEAWTAGARALLLRNATPSMLTAALVAVQHGLVVIDPALAEAVLPLREEAPVPEDLTPREGDVLRLLAEGLPNKLIADRLQISENTVKFHVNAILSKFGAHSRTEAVVRAARLGFLVI